jgi:hypothetical protein
MSASAQPLRDPETRIRGTAHFTPPGTGVEALLTHGSHQENSPNYRRLAPGGVVVQNYSDPQSLNRYSYTRNNPLRFIDPTGHQSTDDLNFLEDENAGISSMPTSFDRFLSYSSDFMYYALLPLNNYAAGFGDCIGSLGGLTYRFGVPSLAESGRNLVGGLLGLPNSVDEFSSDYRWGWNMGYPVLAGLGAAAFTEASALVGGVMLGEAGLTRAGQLSTTLNQLEAKFKHAADFGVTLPRGRAGFDAFGEAVTDFVQQPGVQQITGTFRGQSVIFNVNAQTALTVISDRAGNFMTGFRLNAEQLINVLARGSL